MRYLKLFPGSSPDVSALCLGTGSFGSAVSRADAFAQMDRFYGYGGNFFDTARVYADWAPGGHGISEKTLGGWIKERKCRDKVVVSTKGAHPDLKTMNIPRMSMKELRSDLEDSLLALDTGYIDLYFLHRDDVSRPVEEILSNLEIFRKEGKILNYGCSNWTLPRIIEAMQISRDHYAGFSCNQIRFGLADVNKNETGDSTTLSMDNEFYAWHQKTKMPVMGFSSSCKGYFSKKLKGAPVSPAQERIYDNPANRKLLEKLALWEKQCNVSTAVLVSGWVMAQKFPSVPIASFSSPAQMDETIKAADFDFPAGIMDEIAGIKRFLST